MTQEDEKDKIIVIGYSSGAGLALIKQKDHGDVILVSADESEKGYTMIQKPTFPTHDEIFGTKSFVCKGKHEYRKVNNEWVCQCGRKL